MKRFLVVMFILSFSCVAVFARDISVEAEISKKQMALGDSARFTVTVEGSQSAEPPQITEIDGLDIRYLGPSTQVSIVNGQYSSSVAHTYSVFPMKVGTYQIPALNVDIDGQVFQTTPINVEVTAVSAAQAASGSSKSVTDMKDKMFVVLKTSKTEAYVNEPVPVKIFLFVASDVAVGDVQLPRFSAEGFDKSDFKYKQYQKVAEGVRFSVIEFETAVSPQHEGELTLGPAEIPFNMIVESDDDSGRGNFFNDPFFSSFFQRQETRPVALQSDAVKLTVKPLPDEGKPSDFAGAIGQFTFDMTVSPNEVEVGDPLTVQMKIGGSGFLSDTELPALKDSADFKVYDPSQKFDGGSKSMEQVVIPLSDQVKEFPAVKFSYFDTSDGKYHTIQKGPFSLKVKPASHKAQTYAAPATGLQPVAAQAQPETLGEDIVFIKEDPGHLRPIGTQLYHAKIFYAAVVVYLVLWLGVMLGLVFRRRLKTDQAFADQLKAAELARKGLARLRDSMKNPAEFYDGAHKLLNEYFSRKLRMPPGDVSADAIIQHPRWKAPEDVNRLLSRIFEECENIRFASMESSDDQMRETLKNIETVIRHSEKVIR